MPQPATKNASPGLPSGFSVAPSQEPDPLSDEALSKDDKIDIAGLKGKWNQLTRQQKQEFTDRLPAANQAQLYDILRGNKHEVTLSAPPKFTPMSMLYILSGRAEEDPWVRDKVANLTNRAINTFPAIGGTVGGVVGGMGGEAVWPAGGAFAGGVAGAGAGGAAGEAARQGALHWLGWDKNDEPETADQRWNEIKWAGIENAIVELLGRGTGKVMRPTLDRAIKKLYFAGGLEHGNPMEEGALESIYPDLQKMEKANPVRDTKSLINLISKTKEAIGKEVDDKYNALIPYQGKTIFLGDKPADTTVIGNKVQNLINKYSRNKDVNRDTIEALKPIKILAETPRTLRDLLDWRIQINDQLRGFYAEHPGGQRVILSNYPDKLAYKEIADAIREITYPEMDKAAGWAPGTTAELQRRRGAAMELEKQALDHREALLTKSKEVGGASPWKRGGMTGYVTSKGKIGAAAHKVTSIVHAPSDIADADKRAASAFGHTWPQKVAKTLSSRAGIAAMGAAPRLAMSPSAKPIPPEQLKVYQHIYVNPATKHKIGSDDLRNWFDLVTGERVE